MGTTTGFGAGAGGGFGLNKPGFGPAVKNFAPESSDGKGNIQVDAEVVDAWKKVLDDDIPLGWVIAVYADDNKSLVLQESGEGGLKEFKERLPEDRIAWGGFRCYGVDKRGGTECKRSKFIFVMWAPLGVSVLKRAKAGPHKGEVKKALDGAHVDVSCESLDDFDEQELITKLQGATGAHKPNGYEFEEGKFIESDYYGLGVGEDCKGESQSRIVDNDDD